LYFLADKDKIANSPLELSVAQIVEKNLGDRNYYILSAA